MTRLQCREPSGDGVLAPPTGGHRRPRAAPRALVLLAVVALSTQLGCNGGPRGLGSVRIVYHHAMVTLDPHAHNDAVTGTVLASVYEGLVEHEPGRPFRPVLAANWTTPSDTVWRFDLRSGVRFHDGRPLQVGDVVAALRRARFGADSTLATYLEAITDVRAVEGLPGTLEVETAEPFPLLLARLSMVAIVPPEADEQRPVGTGPYVWVAGTVRGPVELRRWEGYWGEPPAAERVEVRFAETDEEIGRLVAAGQADVVAAVGEDHVREGWRVQPVFRISTTMLGLNVSRPPLDDPVVRRAIDLAIDRQGLVAAGLADGAAEPAVSLVPAEVFGFCPTNRLFPADLGRARELLSARGAPAPVELHLDLDRGALPDPTLRVLTGALRSLGFEPTLRVQPYAELYRRLEQGDVEAFVVTWNFSSGDASEFLESMVHTRDPVRGLGLLNGSGFSDPQLDRWVVAASREPAAARRLELLRWSLARVANDRPYLPLLHRARLALVREPFAIEPRPGFLVGPADIRPRG